MRNIRQLLVAFLMSVVVACGGGGTLGTSGTPETPKYAATLKLMTAAGVESNQLSAQSPLTLEVVLTSGNGGAINGKLISFELSNSTVAQFSNGTASAVTDSSGVARISLLVGQSSGAAEITATLPDGSKKTIAFQSQGVVPVSYSGSIKLLNASGAETGTLSQAVPLTVELTLSSSSGGNLSGQIVRFALSDNAVGQFDNATASAVTDAKGVAKIGLTVGTKSGAAELSATLPDNSVIKKAFLSAGDSPSTDQLSLTLSMVNADGTEVSAVSKDKPVRVRAQLKSKLGLNVANQQINFSINVADLARFSNGSGTAQTNSSGVAEIILAAGTKSGTGTITAELNTDKAVKASKTFDSAGDGGPVSYSSTIKLVNPNGVETGTLSYAAPLTVELTLTSGNGGVVSGQVIKFALTDKDVAQFDNATASAVTDAKGVAKIGLTVGVKSGAAELIATLPDNTVTRKAFVSAGDNPAADQLSIVLSMIAADGTEVSAVSKDKPVRVRAQLKSKLGLNVANQQINFSINVADLARFSNGSGTAQTNSSGVAEIVLAAGTKSGTGTITAELNTDKAVKASKTFDSAGDGGPVSYSSTIKLVNPNGVETGTLSYAVPLTVELTLTSGNGGVVSGQVIKFALSDKDVAQFDNATASAVTDAKGVAKIGLTVGIKSGAAELIATLPDNTFTRKAFVSAGDNPAADQLSIVLSMLAADGTEVSAVSKDKPVKVRAQLKSKLGLNVANQQINFAINLADLARFSNSVATAQTNSSGVAEIGLTAGTASGTGTLTAELNSNKNVNASKSFDSAGDGGAVTTDPVSTVLLQSDKLQVGSGTLDKVELTAIVRDRQQNLLKDVTVKFGIETGYEGEIEVQSATTDSTGTARAVLTTKTNPALRDILVSATAGAGTAKSYLTLKVVGTDIEVASAPAVVLGSSIDMTFTVLDSAAKPIRDTVLSLSSELKNSFSNTSPRTDAATGRATVRYTAVNAGNDTVTVSALGVIKTVRIEVNADAFAYVKPANEAEIPEIALNTPASSIVKWTRSGSPIAAQDVGFTTTRGVIAADVAGLADNKVVSTIQTNASGEAQIFMRSAFAGLASISANTRGGGASLQTQKVVEFIATIPDPARPLEVQAIPAQLAPGDKAIIQAIVRDANNNPVKNKEIAFSLVDSFGGQLSPATARTNSQGIATTEFTADTTTPGSGNPQDPKGLKIKATISDNDAISGTTAISVGNRTLFFRFATGNGIEESADKVLYKKKYAVLVTDSTGNPVPNQVLTVSALPKRYNKGHWFKRPVNQAFKFWEPVPSTTTDDLTCLSEDKNRNGILDAGEDENGDKQLTPGNVTTVDKNITAGADGIAYFTLTYAKTMAPFVDVEVVVSGFAAGTENVSSRTVALSYSSEDTTDEAARPWASPFGVDALQNDEGFTTRDICAINGQTFPKLN